MSQAVIKVSPEERSAMKAKLQGKIKDTSPPYADFQAKVGSVTITAYHSGKVVFQGKGAEEEAIKWGQVQGKDQKSTSSGGLPSGFSGLSVLGSDETGTGSYFGPLTVCAAYVSKDQLALVQEMGVRDSKMLTDQQMKGIAQDLIATIPYSLLILEPEKYNDLQARMNQNKMKALMHNQALKVCLKKIAPEKPEAILIDQFTPAATYYRYLEDEEEVLRGDSIYFETQAEQKHLAVAAASIIARAAFIQKLEAYSRNLNIPLPSGANTQVDQTAARVLHIHGEEALKKVAKLHFSNTDKARTLAKGKD